VSQLIRLKAAGKVSKLMDVLSVLVMIGSGIVAGVLFAVALSVMPALMAMTPTQYVYTHKLLGRRYDRIMPFIVSGCILADIALAISSANPAAALFALAATCMAGVALISQTQNVPINRRVKSTEPEDIGTSWEDPRFQWRNWHFVRTCFAIAGCMLTAVAVVHP
jgi:uncharacterized membrane protein